VRPLRDRCPVHHTTEPASHYSLSRDADVVAAQRDNETWSSKSGPDLAFGEMSSGVLVSSAPPLHATERLAISRAFRPSVLKAMEADLRALTNELMAGFVGNGCGSRLNVAGLVNRALPDATDPDLVLARAEWLIALTDGVALQAVFDPESWPPDRQLESLEAALVVLGQDQQASSRTTADSSPRPSRPS
jgi:hypothetical protein